MSWNDAGFFVTKKTIQISSFMHLKYCKCMQYICVIMAIIFINFFKIYLS